VINWEATGPTGTHRVPLLCTPRQKMESTGKSRSSMWNPARISFIRPAGCIPSGDTGALRELGPESNAGPRFDECQSERFPTLFHSERWRAELRLEAYNFSNTPPFGTPGSTVGLSTFGLITSTSGGQNDSRFVRIALRIAF
jgi:hypothetical protein